MSPRRRGGNQYFLDTSALIARATGFEKQVAVLDSFCSHNNSNTSTYITMEFKRALLLPLARLYVLVAKNKSLEQGAHVLNQDYKGRWVKVLVLTLLRICTKVKVNDDYRAALREIAALMRYWLAFPSTQATVHNDHTACKYASVKIEEPLDDAAILNFTQTYARFEPDCQLTEFWNASRAKLERLKDEFAQHGRKRYRTLSELYEGVLDNPAPDSYPAGCKTCWKLGDTVITLCCRRGMILLSTDESHQELARVLDIPFRKLDSIVSLDKEDDDDPDTDTESEN